MVRPLGPTLLTITSISRQRHVGRFAEHIACITLLAVLGNALPDLRLACPRQLAVDLAREALLNHHPALTRSHRCALGDRHLVERGDARKVVRGNLRRDTTCAPQTPRTWRIAPGLSITTFGRMQVFGALRPH